MFQCFIIAVVNQFRTPFYTVSTKYTCNDIKHIQFGDLTVIQEQETDYLNIPLC